MRILINIFGLYLVSFTYYSIGWRGPTPPSDGAFGDWPEDFDDVALEVEGAYLDAVEARIAR